MIRKSITSLILLASPFSACTFKTVTPIEPISEVAATEAFEQVLNTDISILFVVDNSGSMQEEQQNLKANVAKFVDVIAATGAAAKFAVVTSDVDFNGFNGAFFNAPTDVKLGNGTIIQEIPNNSGGVDNETFCNDVVNASNLTQRGILDPADPALVSVIANAGQIRDFNGRENGVFIDTNNDKVADNFVTASFADAVGCMISSGIRGSGQESHLCAMAASLDEDSLANENAGFLNLTNPDNLPLLAVIHLADEDDGTDVGQENAATGEFECSSLFLGGSPIQGLLSASSEQNVCGSGVDGAFDTLESVTTFSDRLLVNLALPQNKIFVASIAGPPGSVIADCARNFPVPSCSNAFSGAASPGNRLFQFAQQFTNKFDALDFNICDPNFGDGIAEIAAQIGSLLNGGCLNNPVVDNFDPETDMRVLFDITDATDITSCDEILPGQQVADEIEPNICKVKAAFLDVQAVELAVCTGGFQVGFVGFNPPTGAKVTIEYLAVPN
jgi:hypothetical protein